jgi:hypothetical protein
MFQRGDSLLLRISSKNSVRAEKKVLVQRAYMMERLSEALGGSSSALSRLNRKCWQTKYCNRKRQKSTNSSAIGRKIQENDFLNHAQQT